MDTSEQTETEEKSTVDSKEASPDTLRLSSPTLKSIEDEEDDKVTSASANDVDKPEEGQAAKAESVSVPLESRRLTRKRAAATTADGEGSSDTEEKRQRKKSWSTVVSRAKKGDQDEEAVGVVSSESLKDLLPSVSVNMDEDDDDEDDDDDDDEEEQEEDKKDENGQSQEGEEGQGQDGQVGNQDGEENKEGKDDDDDDDVNDEGAYVKVVDLVRPYTLSQLKALLTRTGELYDGPEGFCINKIKSECVVRYKKASCAKDTIASINNIKWPSTNPKRLRVSLVDEADFRALASGGGGVTTVARAAATHHPEERSRNRDEEGDGKEKPVKSAPKPLEELFRSTKATPLLYWKTAV